MSIRFRHLNDSLLALKRDAPAAGRGSVPRRSGPRRSVLRVAAGSRVALAALIVTYIASGQGSAQAQTSTQLQNRTQGQRQTYNPYPPDILPPDLDQELERVRREVDLVFERYLEQSRTLTPPTVTSNPPTLQGTGYEAVRILGGC
jgi:hypothetical protein